MSTVVALPPSSPVVPRAGTAPPVPITRAPFNRWLLDRQDPLDGTGRPMQKFSYSVVYPVAPEKHATVLEALYRSVYARLHANSVSLARPALVDYDDARTGVHEDPRRYVVVRGDTIRSTHMDVFATFRSCGDYLYVAIDSFLLPPLSFLRLLLAICVAAAITMVAPIFTAPVAFVLQMMGMIQGAWFFTVACGFLFVTCPLVAWWNRDVIRSLRHGDPLDIALRRHYYRWRPVSAFDDDDVLAFYKSTTRLVTEEITAVFKANGIPVEELTQIQQNINLSNSVINNGFMSVVGSMLVGVGNALNGGSN